MNKPARVSPGYRFTAVAGRCALTIALAAAAPAQASAENANPGDLPNGFYRDRGTPTVYRVQDGSICAVISEGHLKALGATHRSVQVLNNPVDFLNGKSSQPPCAWPDGLYRRKGETTIIKISDGTACVLTSTDQDVIEVGSDDPVVQGKNFLGRCTP